MGIESQLSKYPRNVQEVIAAEVGSLVFVLVTNGPVTGVIQSTKITSSGDWYCGTVRGHYASVRCPTGNAFMSFDEAKRAEDSVDVDCLSALKEALSLVGS